MNIRDARLEFERFERDGPAGDPPMTASDFTSEIERELAAAVERGGDAADAWRQIETLARRFLGKPGLPLWRLRREDDGQRWDETVGFIVSARTNQEARLVASKDHGDEGAACWKDESLSSCELIAPTSCFIESEIALQDFHAA
jgi:hypothetical protein